MKPLLVLCVLTVCASIALAQPGGQPNSVGIYFDEAGTTSGWATPGTGTVYVLLKNPDLPLALKAWDLAIGVVNELHDGYIGAFHQPASVSTGVTIIVQENDYACAYSEPLVVTGESFVMLEAEFGLFSDPLPDDHACLWTYPAQITPEVPDQITLLLADGTPVTGSYSIAPEDIAWIAQPGCGELLGSCTGVVDEFDTPVPNVLVSFLDGMGTLVASATTNSAGRYSTDLEIPIGDYTLTALADGFLPYEEPITIFPGVNVHDFDLSSPPFGLIRGAVRYDGSPVADINVCCTNTSQGVSFCVTTDASGRLYSAQRLPLDAYRIRVDEFPFEIYQQMIDIVAGLNEIDIDLVHLPIGTVSGVVSCDGVPVEGVTVDCLDQTGVSVFASVSDEAGYYTSVGYIDVGDYTLVVDEYGFEPYERLLSVDVDAVTADIELQRARTGTLFGRVVVAETEDPLSAVVGVYRADNNELIEEMVCDATGVYSTSPMAYYDYQVQVWFQRYEPQTQSVTVAQPETAMDFALTPLDASILFIDDSDAMGRADTADVGNRHSLETDIRQLGHSVETAPSRLVDPTLLGEYDLVVLSCGDNLTPLADATLKNALLAFAQQDGHLLLEGGELAARHIGDAAFRSQVLHCQSFIQHQGGHIAVADSTVRILSRPNQFSSTDILFLDYSGPGDGDVVAPAEEAAVPMKWQAFPTRAAVITYDPNPAPAGGQIVFFAWNYGAAVGTHPGNLLQNAVQWLLEEEDAQCSVSGTVLLAGCSDHSGITVKALPGGGQVVTGPDGSYTLSELHHGVYTITASRTFYTTESVEVDLTDVEQATDVDMILEFASSEFICTGPMLPLPEGTTRSQLFFPESGRIYEVRVFLDILHPNIGDLAVLLSSPSGRFTLLHNATGEGEANLFGTYPTELEPVFGLDVFTDDLAQGEWTLMVSNASSDLVGVLNAWCLDIYHDGGLIPVGVQPLTVDTTNGMCLSWRYLPTACDGFNVYRRTDATSAERLNSGLLASSDGRIEFVDLGEDLNDGQSVFYRYAVVSDGIESAFGDEVAAVFHRATPQVCSLHDNYPNPFNPTTSIAFALNEPGPVRLAVYDVTGRLIRTLVDETRGAGQHTAVWDGTDQAGNRAASGSYFYTLATDSYRATKKMMLVK